MEISTFKVKVQKAVSEVLGQEYTVELREVQKNNGVLLQGLMIRKGQDNVTPTIYLNSFWEAYEGGVTFADIIKKIIMDTFLKNSLAALTKYSVSLTPAVSYGECMESCGRPISTVFIGTCVLEIFPSVEPPGMSERLTNVAEIFEHSR